MARRRSEFAQRSPSEQRDPESTVILSQLLAESAIPRDALPYTEAFDELKRRFVEATGKRVSHADFWRALTTVGRRSRIAHGKPRKRAARTPSLSREQQLEVLRLFPEGLGARDQLPYTEEFDRLHRRFREWTGLQLTKHEFWRAVSRVGRRSRKPRPLFAAAPQGDLPETLVRDLEMINPWWRGRREHTKGRYRRWAVAEAMKRLDAGLAPVIAVRGPRQVGKTTIQSQLIEELLFIRNVPVERILRVQFDFLKSLGSVDQPLLTIARWYEDEILKQPINHLAARDEPVYFFFDELQNVQTWDAQLKYLVDHVSPRVLATGSSALRIARGRDNLAGRLSDINLGPLHLHEIAGIRCSGDLPAFAAEQPLEEWTQRAFWLELAAHARKHKKILEAAFKQFSRLGGYPRCHTVADSDVQLIGREVVNTVVDKTVKQDVWVGPTRKRLDPSLLQETWRLLCRYAGREVKSRTLAQELEQVLESGIRPSAVSEAVQFFVDAMLLHRVPPLELRSKKQPHAPKVCICDHFVRNAFLREYVPIDPDGLAKAGPAQSDLAGYLVESIIGYYFMGIPGLDVAWFPTRHDEPEIDYVLTIGATRIPIEVKYRRGSLKPAYGRGIESFCRKPAYGASFGLVVTQDQVGEVSDHALAVPASHMLLLR